MKVITDYKDLWSGTPLWTENPYDFLQLSSDIKNTSIDIAVVGAGSTGAVIGEALASAGYSVLFIDRRKPASGSSMASTAMLQADVDLPLIHMIDMLGFEKAARAWRRSGNALQKLAIKTKTLCDIYKRPSLYISGDLLSPKELKEESRIRRKIMFPSEYLDEEKLYSRFDLKNTGAILTPESYAVNPQTYAMAYLSSAVKKGAKIYAPFDIEEIEPGKNAVHIISKENKIISAQRVVFATGYETLKELDFLDKKITSSWAIATKPQPRNLWPNHANIWEASDPYLYIRTTPDGRIICGGEDQEFEDTQKRDALINKKAGILSKKLKNLFPDIDETVEFSWAGSFGETETSLPLFGEVPGLSNCYATLCFGGNGMTFAQIASEFTLQWVKGKTDPDQDIFSF